MGVDDKKNVRNPLLLPEKEKKQRGCPKCGCPDFDGFAVQGVVTRKCRNKECRNVWSGGLPQVPVDPTVPQPYAPDQSTISFEPKAPGSEQHRDLPVGVTEVVRRPDTRPDFRKGALIPPDGEE